MVGAPPLPHTHRRTTVHTPLTVFAWEKQSMSVRQTELDEFLLLKSHTDNSRELLVHHGQNATHQLIVIECSSCWPLHRTRE